ncbi:uncharacterized protein LOC131239249 [Magnolia sinica]|uniref:uncharacterized protein LOC131239249 n=1 Tax=Magnolia sinica TaxID=86752 RepID=UPI002657E7D0|nr:uncharacterized protein LOC131239249 [Magnolia sinica]
MEAHSPVMSGIGRKLWNFLRIAFYMMRKGIISKRKLIMDMNLMMKSRKVIGKRGFGNLIFHQSRSAMTPRYGPREYEFSCSNSPNPVLFHTSKRKNHYFPCINVHDDDLDDFNEQRTPVIVLPRIEYSPAYSNNSRFDGSDLAVGERLSPLLSPFSIRVSNCSWDEENDGGIRQVDDEAEEFIRRFYEQLKVQSRTALLQYQENEYQNMLARGTR